MTGQNREWVLPLALTGSTDTVNGLVQTINAHLFQGAQVAFKPQGATNTSYFDLEEGILEPQWDLYEDTAGLLRVSLHLWTRPYAHTGTTRLVASVQGTGILQLTASGVVGDMNALGVVRVGFASGMSATSIFIFGEKYAAASYFQPLRTPAVASPFGGTVIAASGAIGSQALVGTSGLQLEDLFRASMLPGYVGRYRVLLFARQAVSPASSLTYSLLWSIRSTATISAVSATAVSASQWGIYDMGEVSIVPSVLAQTIDIKANATTGASYILGGSSVQFGGYLLLPLDDAGVNTDDYPLGGARETTDFVSYPQTAALRMTNASQMSYNSPLARLSGPEFPPTGTAGTLIVGLAGKMNDYNPGQVVMLSAEARERFSYLR